MFSQRKSFFKGKLFYMILLGLFAFGIWLNQAPAVQDSSEEVKTGTDKSVAADDAVKQGDSGSYDILDNIIGKNPATTPAAMENTEPAAESGEPENKGYFLVKEIGGIIKVFYYNEEGKESLVRETDIAFSLLSIGDQALFQKGIIKQSQEELNELLQDFES